MPLGGIIKKKKKKMVGGWCAPITARGAARSAPRDLHRTLPYIWISLMARKQDSMKFPLLPVLFSKFPSIVV